jgi:ankyrin repeat protein
VICSIQEEQTALIIASDHDRKDLIDLLIDRGADMNAKNQVLHTLLLLMY